MAETNNNSAPDAGSPRPSRKMRFLKWVGGSLLGLVALGTVAQYLVAGYVIDDKLDSVLAKVNAKVPGLELRNAATESSFTGREGRLFWRYAFKGDGLMGMKELNGVIDYRIDFGFLKVSGEFHNSPNEGNLPELLDTLNLEGGDFTGRFAVKALPPGAAGEVRFNPIIGNYKEGKCRIEGMRLGGGGSNPLHPQGNFTIDSVNCAGIDVYAGKPSFEVELKNFVVTVEPEIKDGKLALNEINAALESLRSEVSTIYAIGFPPHEDVRDPTLRDAIFADHLQLGVIVPKPDDKGLITVRVKTAGNYDLCIPHIREGQVQPPYDFHDLKVDATLDRLSPKALLKALGGGGDPAAIAGAFSKQVSLEMGEVFFRHGEDRFALNGHISGSYDPATKRPENLEADLNVLAGVGLLKLNDHDYSEDLRTSFDSEQVTFADNEFKTHIVVSGRSITLNGRPYRTTDADNEETWVDPQEIEEPEEESEEHEE